MSINFTMRRISPEVYDRLMLGEGYFEYRYVAESGEIAKEWDILAIVLANGNRDNPGLAAAAIVGGRRFPGGPDDYGGDRGFSPAEVAEVAEALKTFSEEEFRRRYEELDFTGAYASDGNGRPADDIDLHLGLFRHLRAFYAAAAGAGNAMWVWMT